jgi:hypothetical protein
VRTVLLSLGQLAGALLALAALYRLLGPEWTVLVAGLLLLATCTAAEALDRRRASGPPRKD